MKSLGVLLFFLTQAAFAQNRLQVLGEAKFLPGELIESSIRDVNGALAAGVRIQTDLSGLSFDSRNGVIKVNVAVGEYFLFLSPNERVITIRVTGYFPLELRLYDLGIALKPGQVWGIELSEITTEGVGDLQVIISDAEAVGFLRMCKADSKEVYRELLATGPVSIISNVPVGNYTIEMDFEGFHREIAQILITRNTETVLIPKLRKSRLTALNKSDVFQPFTFKTAFEKSKTLFGSINLVAGIAGMSNLPTINANINGSNDSLWPEFAGPVIGLSRTSRQKAFKISYVYHFGSLTSVESHTGVWGKAAIHNVELGYYVNVLGNVTFGQIGAGVMYSTLRYNITKVEFRYSAESYSFNPEIKETFRAVRFFLEWLGLRLEFAPIPLYTSHSYRIVNNTLFSDTGTAEKYFMVSMAYRVGISGKWLASKLL